MILKQKKNCKMIFCNDKYYIQTSKNLYHFSKDYEEAERYYKNIVEIEKEGIKTFKNGKFRLELYPDDLKLVLRGLEFFKFFVDKNLFFECNFEELKQTSYDIEFLSQYLFCLYNQNAPNEEITRKERKRTGKIVEINGKK